MDKIDVKIINMKNQRDVITRYSFLELHENSLRYTCDFDAFRMKNIEDEDLGWEESRLCADQKILKREVVGTEITLTKFKQWAVYIIVNGISEDIGFFFNHKDHDKAMELHNKIWAWLEK